MVQNRAFQLYRPAHGAWRTMTPAELCIERMQQCASQAAVMSTGNIPLLLAHVRRRRENAFVCPVAETPMTPNRNGF